MLTWPAVRRIPLVLAAVLAIAHVELPKTGRALLVEPAAADSQAVVAARRVVVKGASVELPVGNGWSALETLNDLSGVVTRRTAADGVQWASAQCQWISPLVGRAVLESPSMMLVIAPTLVEPLWSGEPRGKFRCATQVDSSGDAVVARYWATYENRVYTEQKTSAYFAAGSLLLDPSHPEEVHAVVFLRRREGALGAEGDAWLRSVARDFPDTLREGLRSEPNTIGVVLSDAIASNLLDVACGLGSVWTVSWDEGVLIRLDPETLVPTARIPVGKGPSEICFVEGEIWVALSGENMVACVDPASGRVLARVGTGKVPRGMALAGGSLWVANREAGSLTRIDPTTRKRLGRNLRCGEGPAALAAFGDTLWVADQDGKRVVRVDARSGEVIGDSPLGGSPTSIVAGSDAVWVCTRGPGALYRLDPRTGEVLERREVGAWPIDLALSGETVWLSDFSEGSLRRLDPGEPAIGAPVVFGNTAFGLAVDGGRVFVSDKRRSRIARWDGSAGR